jgi:Cd2+/Zn2+-exporting ATPase
LRLAAALEAGSTHPIARALTAMVKAPAGAAAAVPALPAPVVGRFKNLSGFGVKGVVDGVECVLGRRELFAETLFETWAQTLSAAPDGCTEVWLLAVRPPASRQPSGAGDSKFFARFLLRDQVREEAAPMLAQLRRLGIKTVMLTGDRPGAAESVAAKLGVAEVRAGLTPAQKVAAIRELGEQRARVAMVGDGVNDAPPLAAAYVAVGMGARGSDAALEQCDVVLMHDRLSRFLDARALSVRARRVIRQNLVLSLGTIVVMAVATFGATIPLTAGVLAHEGSTILVCLNSMRLLLSRPGRP